MVLQASPPSVPEKRFATQKRAGERHDAELPPGYDGLYRLLGQQDSTGATYAYAYDAAGNRLSAVEPGGSTTATYDAANQLLTLNGLPAQHDANGNLLSDGTQSYTYDALDRLIQVTRGITTTTFGYNGNGDRLWQEVNGQRTSFTLDLTTALTQVLAQTGGGATTYLLPGVGQQVNGAWQYQHTDALGSVRLLSGPAGQVLAGMRYTPFGVLEAQSGPASVFGFTGEPSDPAGDLLSLRARFYHPGIGRFLTPDALIPDPTNGQAWNRYAYVYNDPVNLVDPSGHVAWAIAARAAMTLATGVGLSLYGDWYMHNDPSRQQWWNNKPDCSCQAPADPSLNPDFFLGLVPGAALGIGMAAGGLSADVQRTLVPGPHNPTTQAHLDYAQEQAKRFGGASQRYLDELVDTGAARVRSSVTWGLGEGVFGSTGFLQLGADGVLFAGGLLDAVLQGFFDRDLCLSPRQKYNRMLIAGGLGLAAGGVGLAFSRGARAGAAAANGIGAGIFAGAVNEFWIKPSIFEGFGLQ